MDSHSNVTSPQTKTCASPNPEDEHVDIWISLNRARVALMREVDRVLRTRQLPPLTWYDVLWSVERRGGKARPNEIVDDLLFEPSALSHMSRRMEIAGLLEIKVARCDRRGRVLCITPAGLRARAAIWEIYGLALEERLAPFKELDDRQAVAKALEAVAVSSPQ